MWRKGSGLLGVSCLAGAHVASCRQDVLEGWLDGLHHAKSDCSAIPTYSVRKKRYEPSQHQHFQPWWSRLMVHAEAEQKLRDDLPSPENVTNQSKENTDTKENADVKSKSVRDCVLVVGTTGSGKSSTTAIFTGQEIKCGDGTDSVTQYCEAYPVASDPDGPLWIDTMGYDDSTNISDSESFREVLRFMSEEGLLRIKAVIWTITPQERMDARLQKQAEFINQFKDGAIWSNVIIIVKQPGSFNIQKSSQGALEAAKAYALQPSKIQVLGFTYLDDRIPDRFKKVDSEMLKDMKLLKADQIRELIAGALYNVGQPLRVIFEDSKCTACGVVGDKRLMPDYCHMDEMLVHPGRIQHAHTSELEFSHPLPLESFHSGVLQLQGGPNNDVRTLRNIIGVLTLPLVLADPTAGIVSGILAGGAHFASTKLDAPIEERYSCCRELKHAIGCKVRFACCKLAESSIGCRQLFPCCGGTLQSQGCTTSYSCCGAGVDNSPGCQSICNKCRNPWGTPTTSCYRRNKPPIHNIVRLSERARVSK